MVKQANRKLKAIYEWAMNGDITSSLITFW